MHLPPSVRLSGPGERPGGESESLTTDPPEASAVSTPRISEDAGTAGRVILHLYGLGRLANDEIGAIGFTQRGMVRTLGLRQGTLAKVLSRLRATGVVEVDRRHVAGEPRRMNVYRLTSLGESIARDLKRRRAPSDGKGMAVVGQV